MSNHVMPPAQPPLIFVKLPIFSSDFAEPLLSRLYMQGNYFHAKYTTYHRHYFLKISRMSEVVELELFLKMGFFTSNDPPSDSQALFYQYYYHISVSMCKSICKTSTSKQ